MKKNLFILGLLMLSQALFGVTVPLKSLVRVKGLMDNPVIGYGIVVGLNGTGDSVKTSQTKDIIARIAQKFGFYLDADDLKPKNSAIVMVSGIIPALASTGSRIDVKVSSVFDAKSLNGGELIITPLLSGDGVMYATAQGSIDSDKKEKKVSSVVSLGGMIQKEIPHTDLNASGSITLLIEENLGMENVEKVKQIIMDNYQGVLKKQWQNQIELNIPAQKDAYTFLAELLALSVDIEQQPSILIDSQSAMVVTGGNVIITESAITFKGAKIEVGGTASWSMDNSDDKTVHQLSTMTTVSDLVEGLNSIGASPQDIIQILKLLHQNGNIKAKLQIR